MKKWEKFANVSQNISKNNQYFCKIYFLCKNLKSQIISTDFDKNMTNFKYCIF